MKFVNVLAFLAAVAPLPAFAAQAQPPRLIVAISVDQFSADLFAEYRGRFTGGLKTLSQGVVFPAGYQSHAATETCPGHSTILTGDHPSRTGIIANTWLDMKSARADARVYCAEDESVAGSSADNYVVSAKHLRVPTLGDRMKAAFPGSRTVSIAGKDRAAVMLGGANADEIWWLSGRGFASFQRRTAPAIITRVNARIDAALSKPMPAPPLPAPCRGHAEPLSVGTGKRVGAAPAGLEAGNAKGFRARPELDEATLEIAADLVRTMGLGRGAAPDLLAIGLSATDYVGHNFGTEGAEMCTQMLALDASLGRFLAGLDKSGISYAVVLTADHGGHDAPERNQTRGMADAVRVDPALLPLNVGEIVGKQLGIQGFVLDGDSPAGDIYVSNAVPAQERAKVIAAAKAIYLAHPQVAAVFTADELRQTGRPLRPADEWTLGERAAASFDPQRSGDLIVLLKPHVTPIANPDGGSIATHGSPWNYDRRVPILFWRPGEKGFEQPLPVETIDIMPTLAAMIGLPIPNGAIDGRCLNLTPALCQ